MSKIRVITGSQRTEKLTVAEHMRQLATDFYMMAMFVLVPLLMGDKFRQLGNFKYEVFRRISLIGIGVIFLTHVSVLISQRGGKRNGTKSGRKDSARGTGKLGVKRLGELLPGFSLTDGFVLGYGVFAFLSFCFSVDKGEAFWGIQGWYMGLVSQEIFVISYFFVSRWWSGQKRVWYSAAGAAFAVFLFGVLHRFMIDPFFLYEGLSESTIRQYLSFVGQNTWYSSYMCTVFPLGLFLFWNAGSKQVERIAGGIFLVVGFGSWFTQNSDSAYIALSLMILVLFCYGFAGTVWMERFLETMMLLFGSAAGVGFLQDLFPDRAVLPERISLFLTKSIFPILGFLGICLLYLLLYWLEHKKWKSEGGFQIQRYGWIGKGAVLLYVTMIVLTIGFLVANTTGYLAEWIGISSQNNYLLFNEDWGTGRGRTWRYTVQVIREFPWYRKLFGAGPDCFAAYGYGNPVYNEQLRNMWGDNVLTNAHCEWMNAVVCYGLAGAACYLGIFVSAVKRFWQAGKKSPALIAVTISLLSYMGHNVFCYQQAVCTPFVFLLLGMGEKILTGEKESEV